MRRFAIIAILVFPLIGSHPAWSQETIEPNIKSCEVKQKTLTQSLECNAAKSEERREKDRQRAAGTRQELDAAAAYAAANPKVFQCKNRNAVVLRELADFVTFDKRSGRYTIFRGETESYYTPGGGDICQLIAP